MTITGQALALARVIAAFNTTAPVRVAAVTTALSTIAPIVYIILVRRMFQHYFRSLELMIQ